MIIVETHLALSRKYVWTSDYVVYLRNFKDLSTIISPPSKSFNLFYGIRDVQTSPSVTPRLFHKFLRAPGIVMHLEMPGLQESSVGCRLQYDRCSSSAC